MLALVGLEGLDILGPPVTQVAGRVRAVAVEALYVDDNATRNIDGDLVAFTVPGDGIAFVLLVVVAGKLLEDQATVGEAGHKRLFLLVEL